MTTKTLKSVMAALVVLFSLNAHAYNAYVDGIYYNLVANTKQAEVTSGDNKYTGEVVIPESIEIDGIQYGVTSIGKSAFNKCSGLTSIKIPNSVTSIGMSAFYGCTSLASVSIPNSVASIGTSAFGGCIGLTSVNISNGIKSIGRSAFGGCSSLTSVSIPNSVTSIGDNAFYDCTSLTSVSIGNGVTSIGSQAFSGTPWYENQDDGLVYIGNRLYIYKGTMPENTEIIIKEGTTEILSGAFSGCKSLISVIIPNSVTSIGNQAFYNCSGLTSVTIPNSVTSIGSEAFEGSPWLSNQDDGLVYMGTVLYGYKGTMPENTEIIIKEGTTEINASVFHSCSGLTSVSIPNSVKSIGRSAFAFCYGLTSVSIPNSVTSIGDNAFYDCTSLTSVSIGNGVTSIGSQAFYYCRALTSVHITDFAAWCNCTISSNPLEYAHHLYLNGEEVKDLVIPNGVTSINYGAFVGCSSFTSVSIPSSVTTIGAGAFQSCSSLTSVNIPSSVTSIGKLAFDDCTSLTSVHITDLAAWCNCTISSNPLEYAHHLYLNGEEVKDLVIPNGVTSIGDNAFVNCASLTSVDIPNSVTSIGSNAFNGCASLTSVNIGSGITSIASDAFSGCTGITSVKVNWSRPLVDGASSFNASVKKNATLYVPKGTAMMYMSAAGWSEFVNIMEFEDGEDTHYITIRTGNGGVVKQSVEVGQIYTYVISADEGWSVNTVTFDGKDVTAQLLNGQISTPVITGNSELNVVFKQDGPDEIQSLSKESEVKVYAKGKNITVAGAKDNAPVSVYSTNGVLIKSSVGNVTLPLESGVYIVKVGKDSFKVGL